MINKFQTGGKQTSQGNDAIVKFVQALAGVLKADPKQVIQIAQQNPEALKAAVQVYQKSQNIEQAAQAFSQAVQQTQATQQQQTIAARHGAKLNYLKSLKNQCPEGQEPYYYKKGGMVKCGCAGKKFEDGGEVKKENAITRFKKTITSKKSNLGEGIKKGMKTTTDSVVKTAKAKQWSDEYKRTTKASGINDSPTKDYVTGDKCGGKVKKHQLGGIAKIIVDGTKKAFNYHNQYPYTFDRRELNIGNGRKVISDMIYNYYDDNGNYLGDNANRIANRTIYVSPNGNDTTYVAGTSSEYMPLGVIGDGYLEVPINGHRMHKGYFYDMVKKSKEPKGLSDYAAYKKALNKK